MHRASPFLLQHDAFFLGIATIYTPILSIEHTLIVAIYIWDEIFFLFLQNWACLLQLRAFLQFLPLLVIYALKLFL